MDLRIRIHTKLSWIRNTEEIISVKIVTYRPLSHYTAFHGVQSLYKHQRKMEKWRGAEREEAGGGDIFLMREPKEDDHIY